MSNKHDRISKQVLLLWCTRHMFWSLITAFNLRNVNTILRDFLIMRCNTIRWIATIFFVFLPNDQPSERIVWSAQCLSHICWIVVAAPPQNRSFATIFCSTLFEDRTLRQRNKTPRTNEVITVAALPFNVTRWFSTLLLLTLNDSFSINLRSIDLLDLSLLDL